MDINMEKKWEIGLSGIRRFFDEGMAVWSK